ncbi:MAG: DNA mismatch repair protein MutS, partial [Firmicutes bacterium]|nr:DNA mismatch repair protein MutS [Bacillota bacterium]
KSTYMRQLALIVLMAQAGCFVPADSAKIGLCDRIYTRIGASDNIAMGQSTFFVEMSELAYILNTATEKSLVILDEIGRGTSTYDGLSIAWATVERLTKPQRRVRTLFATHYHELTVLADTIKGVRNLNVDVSESGGNIVFLHKIVEGSASRSYGIHVAKLAGVPKEVLDNAQAKLDSLEKGQAEEEPVPAKKSGKKQPEEPQDRQLSLFTPVDSELANMVRNLDLMNITPSQAIGILEELQEKARQ